METPKSSKKSLESLWYDIMGKFEAQDIKEKEKEEQKKYEDLLKYGY